MTNQINTKLKETLEKNKVEYIGYLKDLIAIDTRDLGHGIDGGLEKDGQEYLIKLFEKLGADVKVDPMKEEVIQQFYKDHGEGNLGHNYDDRFNVYASFKADPNKKSLMFNGHIDVMPPGDETLWDNPPFEPVIKDGILYGRGAADMKSGLMAAIMAVKLLKDAEIDLPGEVIITSVCDEEGGGNGSMQAIASGQRADGVVVCEGTDQELILAHMGFVFFRVEFSGIACHSGMKTNGVNAIEKAIKAINALNELEHKWLLKYKHPLLPPPNLNIGVIKGGTAGSTVPDECYFETCVHYLPNLMSKKQIEEEFMDTINRVAKSDPFLEKNPPKVTIYQAGNGFEMDLDHGLVNSFKNSFKLAMDKEVKAVGSPAGCDSRLWRSIAKMPTIQFGPGSLKMAHAINECVPVEEYLNAILIYANLILDYCK